MRVLLISARPEVATNRRFAEAALKQAIDLTTVDGNRVIAECGAVPRLWHEGRDLLEPMPAAVIARVGNWRPSSLLATLEVAVAAGVASPNPSSAMRAGRDHWRTMELLNVARVPVPTTLAGAEAEELAREAVTRLGLPVVVKQRRSRMGVGVILCRSRDHLEAVLDSLWRLGDEVVVQRFVDTRGVSLRLVVVGGETVAAARFIALNGEWRSNAARGAKVEPHTATQHEQILARRAAAALGLGVCGVDLLPGGGYTVVGEINPTPGFLRVEAATGIDVAGAILRFAVHGSCGETPRQG